MKKIALILLFVIGLGFFSCEKKCDDVEPHFQIVSLSPSNLRFTNEGPNPWTTITENDTILWSNYFNRVGFNCNYIAARSSHSFANSLYALSCLYPGQEGSKIGVENVHIVTLLDFDSLFLQNDTIDSIVVLNDWTSTINDFSEFKSIEEYVLDNQSSIKEQHFEFKLLSSPSESVQSAQFKVIYQLENGETFEAITEEVILTQ